MTSVQQQPTISVIIPTFNGQETLEELFATLHRQKLQPIEILVADSSSGDQTVSICEKNGARIWPISQNDFDHGGTRTFLAEKAVGDILVFFTQDAILASRDALSKLIEPLLKNETCACSYGRQLPQHNATWHAAHLRKFNYPEKSAIRAFEDRTQFGLRTIFTSNSFAAYKKDYLAGVGGFKNGLIFGEDTCTVGRILEAGYKIAYAGEAAVYHSHNYSIAEEFRRSFDIGVLHSSEKWLINTFGKAEGIGIKYAQSAVMQLIEERRYLLIPDFIARVAMKYLGYKLGRSYSNLPLSLLPTLSMNRNWWRKEN